MSGTCLSVEMASFSPIVCSQHITKGESVLGIGVRLAALIPAENRAADQFRGLDSNAIQSKNRREALERFAQAKLQGLTAKPDAERAKAS